MIKIFISAASIAALLISGCASQPRSTFETFHAQDLNGLLSSGQYVQKADNFFVINDSSSSMTDEYFGIGYPAQPTPTKFSVEKEILNRINQTIPDLKLTSSIRSFGFGNCLSWGYTQLNQAPTSYSKSTFGSGIDVLACASGISPIASGIDGTGKDLSATAGNIAVLILSDGHYLGSDGVTAMQSLKQQYGDRLCVYTVWVGNEEEKYGQTNLNQFSNIAGCGYGTTADRISSPDGMANFVKSIFLKAGAEPPPAPEPVAVIPEPTPPEHISLSADALFDFNKAVLRPRGRLLLSEIADQLQGAEYAHISVIGHADRLGSPAYNQKLSEERAEAAKSYLINNGIPSQKIHSEGKGATQPVTTPDQCKRLNRRDLIDCLQPDRRVDIDVTATK